MRKIEVQCEEGICPLCGREFKLTSLFRYVDKNRTLQKWKCDCGASGWQSMNTKPSFDGSHFAVKDANGSDVEILPVQAKIKTDQMAYIVLSTIWDIDDPRYNEIRGCFSTLEAAQACMLDAAKNSSHFDFDEPFSQDCMSMLSYDESAPLSECPNDWEKIEIIPILMKENFPA